MVVDAIKDIPHPRVLGLIEVLEVHEHLVTLWEPGPEPPGDQLERRGRATEQGSSPDRQKPVAPPAAPRTFEDIYERPLSDLEEGILHAWQKHIGEHASIYTFPGIPLKMLRNALLYARIQPDEIVVGIGDGTELGSAKLGFVVTSKRLIWNRDQRGEYRYGVLSRRTSRLPCSFGEPTG
jgi:hypothetical protein